MAEGIPPLDTVIAFRGPLIVASVCCGILLPYIFQSWQTTITCLILLSGILISIHDVSDWLTKEFRRFLRNKIEGISLDDILETVHDAEANVLGATVGSLLGQFSMYGLPCTEEQRVRLFQSCMEVRDERRARQMLTEPGGWRYLLPDAARDWIFAPDEAKMKLIGAKEAASLPVPDYDTDSNNSACLSDASDLYEAEKERVKKKLLIEEVSSKIGVYSENEGNRPVSPLAHSENMGTDCHSRKRKTKSAVQDPAPLQSPADVFVSVLKEMAMAAMNHHISQFSTNRTLEITGAITSAALFGNLCFSRRSRRLIWNLFSAATTAGLSAAWIASMGLLLVKHRGELQTFMVRGRARSLSSFPWFLKSELKKIITKMKEARWQGLIAAVVLMYCGRRRVAAQLQTSRPK